MQNEIWKDVIGYEGLYKVSNLGRVRSLDRVREEIHRGTLCRKTYPGKILNPTIMPRQYTRITLANGGKNKHVCVHRIVLEAFVPQPADKPIVNHKDGNKGNNRVDNLEWCTSHENSLHAKNVLKSILFGEDAKAAKLTEGQVQTIRDEYKNGGTRTYAQTAMDYRVDPATIFLIVHNLTWNHIVAMSEVEKKLLAITQDPTQVPQIMEIIDTLVEECIGENDSYPRRDWKDIQNELRDEQRSRYTKLKEDSDNE